MSLFLDIGKGAGLAGATGVRPFLPPLLAGALARGDIGIDFSHTDFSFLESPAFLAGVLAVAVLAYAVERSRGGRAPEGRDPFSLALAGVALALGALLFAGSLADGNHQSWPGLIAGAACGPGAASRGARPRCSTSTRTGSPWGSRASRSRFLRWGSSR